MEEESDTKISKIINDNDKKESKASYKTGLWMYFDSIKDKFFFDRTKAKSLLYIISQKNDLEYEYSENLKYLYNQFISQFEHISPSNNKAYNENTLNITINALISNLKDESELYSNHSKYVLENIIKPMEGFIMNQCEISYELIDLMNIYEKEFKFVNQQLEQKQNNFHHGGKSLEIAMNKLELIKNKIKSKNDEEENFNEHLFKLDEEGNDEEVIEKLKEMVKNNSNIAKQLQIEYEEYIKKANGEREKYIKLSEHLYDKIQNLDEEYMKMMKNQLKCLIDKQISLIENIKNSKLNMLQYTDEINIENDINLFINSKLTKFYPPKPFEYMQYSPDIFLKCRKGYNDSIQSEISLKVIENLKQLFKCERLTKNIVEEENINFVNETVNDIWDGNNYNKNKLENLFKEHIYRLRFLRMLNQYRVEGIFILQSNSFQNFCMTLSSLLDKAIENEDYECIKLAMILSQTFYLQTEKKILLQSGIALNKIWQEKTFWVNMIEYSISEEVNSSKGYMVFLEEDSQSRERRVESSVMSNLITFLFNMKLFGYSEEESKEVIDEFIEKYKIDGSVIYDTEVSMKDIKEDTIAESADNVLKYDIKEENENKLIRKNTNNSKTDEKNTSINSSFSSKDNK